MKTFFGLVLMTAFAGNAALAERRDDHERHDRDHERDHERHDRNRRDNDDAELAGAGVLVALLSSSTLAGAFDDNNSRTVLEDVAATIVAGEESDLLNNVLAEMSGTDVDAKKALLLKKIEAALAQ